VSEHVAGSVRSGRAVPGATEPIRVLVVDDHALFRRGLEMVLGQETDIEVVGEAGDGSEAVDLASTLLPDIVLMDVRMPRRSGIEACTAIKDVVPSAKIVMLTISDDEADLYDAIKAGASGYLLKEISIDEVAAAIRSVAGGQSLISPSMASKLLTEFATMIKKGDERQQVPAPRLTDRELEVLTLVARGMSNGRPRPSSGERRRPSGARASHSSQARRRRSDSSGNGGAAARSYPPRMTDSLRRDRRSRRQPSRDARQSNVNMALTLRQRAAMRSRSMMRQPEAYDPLVLGVTASVSWPAEGWRESLGATGIENANVTPGPSFAAAQRRPP
jgi:DNA-binding NarL/FixJ family response regulator